jgi:hypothetical protein
VFAASVADREAIRVRRLYDGTAWHEGVTIHVDRGRIMSVDATLPADREVGFVLPALVDAHVRIYGYSEVPEPDPLSPERRFLELAARAGVAHVVDVELDPTRIATLRRGSSLGQASILGVGPCVSVCGRSRLDLVVDADMDVAQTLAVTELVRRGWRSSHDTLSVCGCAVDELTRVGLVERARRLFVRPCDARGLARWQIDHDRDVTCVGRERAEVSTVDGLLTSQLASLAEPVLPFVANLPGVGSKPALLIAKRAARRFLPETMPERLEPSEIASIEQEIRRAPELVVGTGASQPGAVPGIGVWQELAHVERVRGSLDDALRAATLTAGEIVGDLAGDSPGRVVPGLTSSWLEGEGEAGSVDALRAGLRRVVVAGHSLVPAFSRSGVRQTGALR